MARHTQRQVDDHEADLIAAAIARGKISGQTKATYEIIQGKGGFSAIKCLNCGRTSYNLNDIRERYCGYCHQFHDFTR